MSTFFLEDYKDHSHSPSISLQSLTLRKNIRYSQRRHSGLFIWLVQSRLLVLLSLIAMVLGHSPMSTLPGPVLAPETVARANRDKVLLGGKV